MKEAQEPEVSRLFTFEYPAIWHATNRVANEAQATYVFILRANLFLLFLTPAIALLASSFPVTLMLLPFPLVLSTVASLVLVLGKVRERWYGGRAATESIKSSAWKYAMRAAPFDNDLESEMKAQYIREVDSILKQNKARLKLPAQCDSTPEQISNTMLSVRAMSWQDRKLKYCEARIDEQYKWYSARSNASSRKSSVFFSAVILAQASACISAFICAYTRAAIPNFASVFSSLASVCLAWLNFRAYDTVSQAYSIAAVDLMSAKTVANDVLDEATFRQFVSDTENAISREHVMWVSRRELP